MVDVRKVVNAQMAALIDGTFGCLEAAAETINARNGGHVSKGTLSKRLSGQFGWPVEDVAALEDASGKFLTTKMLARRMKASGQGASPCLYAASGIASKEVGEAISAALRAAQSADDADTATAIQETTEAVAALQALLTKLEAME